MKTPQSISLLILAALLMVSCEKYLDIKTTNVQSPIESAEQCQQLLDNYSVMNNGMPYDGTVSADEYYLNPLSTLLDGGSQEDRAIYLWDAGAIRALAQPQWQRPYNVIYYANVVIEYAEKIGKKGEADVAVLNALRGSALFFRAFAHWQVAQLYARPYSPSTASQDPGIPLRLVSDINEKSVRGTVEQTYSRLVQDLQEAVTLLPESPGISSRPNKAAGYALLARVYQCMEDYPSALAAANASLQLRSGLLDYNGNEVNRALTTNTPFTRFNREVLFAAVMFSCPLLNPGAENNPVAILDPDLAASYDANDLRKTVLMKPNKIRVGTVLVPDGTYRFTGNYNQSAGAELFMGLAVDEVYLIRAECYARTGRVQEAMDDLNTLLRTRWVTGTYINMIATSSDDALVKVLTERKKELLFRGLRWTDLRRLNKDSRFSKTQSRTVKTVTYTLPPNDPRYTLLIPADVTNYGGIPQNTR